MGNIFVFRLLPLFFLLGLLCFPAPALSDADFLRGEYLSVPTSDFLSSLVTTIDAIKKVDYVVSKFGRFFVDFRLGNAISDCLDFLDFSVDELSWTLDASKNPNGKHNSTGDLSSDLRTWLSAAMTNLETCVDGFQGTNGMFKSVVAESVGQVTSKLRDLLAVVQPSSKSGSSGGKKGGSDGGSHHTFFNNNDPFPSWVKPEDMKLIEADEVSADVVVTADGTGNFTNITAAVAAAPDNSMRRFVIYIKRGVYKENVEVKKKKWNIMMVGDGINATVISGNWSHVDGWTTFRTATFGASGRGFIARDITFENTAGPGKHQAVALRSDSDLSVFLRCEIRGYQDSLYTHSMRQFFKQCTIRGTVDFIFGDATVVFQDCLILAKQGLPSQKNTITAHGRTDPNQPTGFSLQFCNITADSDLLPFINSTLTYLGRPWKPYSRTIVMQSNISDAVRPEGWLEWNGTLHLDTLYYAEYKNNGPGSELGRRVRWPGYHVLNTSVQAENFTVAQFIEGDLWLPSTGVKYTAGLGE
ncbi:hypothetical protein SLE2022_038300 [Rubroshorea leprosula]